VSNNANIRQHDYEFVLELLNYGKDAYVIINKDGEVNFVSNNINSLLGISPNELKSTQTFIKNVHPDYKSYLVRFLRTLLLNPNKKEIISEQELEELLFDLNVCYDERIANTVAKIEAGDYSDFVTVSL